MGHLKTAVLLFDCMLQNLAPLRNFCTGLTSYVRLLRSKRRVFRSDGLVLQHCLGRALKSDGSISFQRTIPLPQYKHKSKIRR